MKSKIDNDSQILEENQDADGSCQKPVHEEGQERSQVDRDGEDETAKRAALERGGSFLQKLTRHFDSNQDKDPTTPTQIRRRHVDDQDAAWKQPARVLGGEHGRERNNTVPPTVGTLDYHV